MQKMQKKNLKIFCFILDELMKRCPTCNAKYKGKTLCYRCKTDLAPLINIEERAESNIEKALSSYASNDFNQMFFHARRAWSLYCTPEAIKLLASAALLVKKFDLAISLWDKIVENQENSP
ncbi:hypothetical protein GMMP1_60011 [Candidatus Magnetomoraceae bacterium gMMP-1]